jgi:hypothetical protein
LDRTERSEDDRSQLGNHSASPLHSLPFNRSPPGTLVKPGTIDCITVGISDF